MKRATLFRHVEFQTFNSLLMATLTGTQAGVTVKNALTSRESLQVKATINKNLFSHQRKLSVSPLDELTIPSLNYGSNKRPSFSVRSQDSGSSTVVAEEVEFFWKGSGTEVLLTGDFLNWNDKVSLSKLGDNNYQVKQKVSVGSHTFKFIVDGVWQHSPDYPTVDDGAGGFNNVIEVKEKSSPPPAPAPPPPAAKAEKAEKKEPSGDAAAPAAKKPAAKAKKVVKPIGAAMTEDIIPQLKAKLDGQEGLGQLQLQFEDNQLRGSFTKDDVPYSFWCFFPDGTLTGARGFSLATHGGAPSTVEPFIIDEKAITPEIVVFWVTKRLFAQKLLSLN